MEREAREQRREIGVVENRIAQKEESIDRKIETFAAAEADLGKRETASSSGSGRSTPARRIRPADRRVRQKLEQTAGMTRDEAKRTLMEQMVTRRGTTPRSAFGTSRARPVRRPIDERRRSFPSRSSAWPGNSSPSVPFRSYRSERRHEGSHHRA
jgi:hypothetical protein